MLLESAVIFVLFLYQVAGAGGLGGCYTQTLEAFLSLNATRVISLTEERLNSPQQGIIWLDPYAVIYAKKYAGQSFFSVFYCSLSPWTCVHGLTQDLRPTLLVAGGSGGP